MSTVKHTESFIEKRRHARINTLNLIGYILYDKDRKKIDKGKGRTLNLSQSGALLETEKPLYGSYIVLMTIDLDGKRVKVKGRVANTRQSEDKNLFLTGIEFLGSKDEQLSAIVAFIKAYHRRKYASQRVQESNS
ncbi:MAG: PilZ domain-containing protein [Desulfobacterales bacterium]|nr:PilZ domain-containing protein [Desulfobacterales bacterium]